MDETLSDPRWALLNGRTLLPVALLSAVAFLSFCPPALGQSPAVQEAVEEIAGERIPAGQGVDVLVNLLGRDLKNADSLMRLRDRLQPEVVRLLGDAIVERVSGIVIGSKKGDLAIWQAVAERLFPPGDLVRRQVQSISALPGQLDELLREADLSKLHHLRDAQEFDSARKVVTTLMQKRLYDSARREAQNGNLIRALRQLAYSGPQTKFGAELLGNITSEVGADTDSPLLEEWPVEDAQFAQFVQELDKEGEEVRSNIAALYSSLVVHLVEANRIEAADQLFSEILRRRPDPDERNDQLRRAIVLSAESPEAQDFAKGRIVELERHGGLNLGTKVRAFFKGYYGSQALSIFIRLIIGIILFFFFAYVFTIAAGKVRERWKVLFPNGVIQKKRSQVKAATLSQTPGQKTQLFDIDPPIPEDGLLKKLMPGGAGKKGAGYLHSAEEPDEYGKLLDLFGLTDSATEVDIKTAFRRKAKELHPDHQTTVDPEGEKQFREYQRAYERLLEIRKSWFGRA